MTALVRDQPSRQRSLIQNRRGRLPERVRRNPSQCRLTARVPQLPTHVTDAARELFATQQRLERDNQLLKRANEDAQATARKLMLLGHVHGLRYKSAIYDDGAPSSIIRRTADLAAAGEIYLPAVGPDLAQARHSGTWKWRRQLRRLFSRKSQQLKDEYGREREKLEAEYGPLRLLEHELLGPRPSDQEPQEERRSG